MGDDRGMGEISIMKDALTGRNDRVNNFVEIRFESCTQVPNDRSDGRYAMQSYV